MPPPIRRETESGLDYVGKGFWFAIGFTPVFIALSALSTLLYVYLAALGLRVSFDSAFNNVPSPVYHDVQPDVRKPQAHVQDSRFTPEQLQERECSRFMLRYSETQDPADKQAMLDVCPK
jgi:hypothetical protein